MTFFNKKQEVMDVQLTRFGKNLLSRGVFKPVYYQFFDDDIIYNIERLGTTEDQNDAETRIKDGARMRTQHTSVGLETSFEDQKKLIASGSRGTFLQLRRHAAPLEKDKLLKYPLANYKVASQNAPFFILKSLGANITGSLSYPQPIVNGIYKNRPEITIRPKTEYTIDRRNIIPEPTDFVSDAETFLDLTGDEIEFLDGSKIKVTKENFIIDLEEFATSYGLDNFEIELYEETEPGSEQYVMIQEEEIYNLINLETDKTVKEVEMRPNKSNFYSE
jgi:hypothetical protein